MEFLEKDRSRRGIDVEGFAAACLILKVDLYKRLASGRKQESKHTMTEQSIRFPLGSPRRSWRCVRGRSTGRPRSGAN